MAKLVIPPSLYSSPELHIRPAESEDMTTVGDLLVAGFPSYAYPINAATATADQAEAARRNATIEHLTDFANNSLRSRKGNAEYWKAYAAGIGQTILVAEFEGRGVVGYAASKQWQQRGELKLAELHDIQVARDFRLQGIGRRLLEQLSEWHRHEQNTATFACFISWAPCRGFYKHLGATMLGELNSVKTAPAGDNRIDFETNVAALLHRDTPRQLESGIAKDVLRHEINRYIGVEAEGI